MSLQGSEALKCSKPLRCILASNLSIIAPSACASVFHSCLDNSRERLRVPTPQTRNGASMSPSQIILTSQLCFLLRLYFSSRPTHSLRSLGGDGTWTPRHLLRPCLRGFFFRVAAPLCSVHWLSARATDTTSTRREISPSSEEVHGTSIHGEHFHLHEIVESYRRSFSTRNDNTPALHGGRKQFCLSLHSFEGNESGPCTSKRRQGYPSLLRVMCHFVVVPFLRHRLPPMRARLVCRRGKGRRAARSRLSRSRMFPPIMGLRRLHG